MTNRPDQVLMTAPQGAAMLQLAVADINKRVTPREFMQTRLRLQSLSHDRPLDIHGLAAHTGLAPINTSFGNRIGRFTTIYFNDKAYVLAGVARNKKEAEAYDRYFLETAQSFHAMTEDDRSLARPLQLKITHVDSNASFSILAGQSPLESYPEEQLRLLNNMFPEGQPRPDMLLKIIE